MHGMIWEPIVKRYFQTQRQNPLYVYLSPNQFMFIHGFPGVDAAGLASAWKTNDHHCPRALATFIGVEIAWR